MEHYINLGLKAMFLENMALAYFLGMCSLLACSKKVDTAIGLGLAVVFVQVLTVPLNNLMLHYLLAEGALTWISPALASVDLSFLSFILFIATIAAATQVVEMAVERYAPELYNSLGVFRCSCRSAITASRRAWSSVSAPVPALPSPSSRWPPSAKSSPMPTCRRDCAAWASPSSVPA